MFFSKPAKCFQELLSFKIIRRDNYNVRFFRDSHLTSRAQRVSDNRRIAPSSVVPLHLSDTPLISAVSVCWKALGKNSRLSRAALEGRYTSSAAPFSDCRRLRRGRHWRLASCQDVGDCHFAQTELVQLFLYQSVHFFLQKEKIMVSYVSRPLTDLRQTVTEYGLN